MEGLSTQELSAIQMNIVTRQIVDVFHQHAKAESPDFWARRHIHGLSPVYLNEFGVSDEATLIKNFKTWLQGKDVLVMYANDPKKESTSLNLPVKDMGLPQWSERAFLPYHQTALDYKKNFIPILNKRCCQEAHASFSNYRMKKQNKTEQAKFDHGFHCSLYDAYELYLCYVTG